MNFTDAVRPWKDFKRFSFKAEHNGTVGRVIHDDACWPTKGRERPALPFRQFLANAIERLVEVARATSRQVKIDAQESINANGRR